MANRRMFSLDVVDTDAFLDLPISSQALYFHLGVRADDDGFVSSPKRVTAMIGANQDDLKLLVVKGFVIALENGIIVIRHWRQNNYIQSDRYKKTVYQTEFERLIINNGVYEIGTDTPCIQTVSDMDTQVSRVKESKEKKRTEQSIKHEDSVKAAPVYFPNDELLDEAFQGYVTMRKQIKKPMTERAIQLAISKLKEMAKLPFSDSIDSDTAIEILNQSTMNSWQGLFPLKDNHKKSTPKTSGGYDWDKV